MKLYKLLLIVTAAGMIAACASPEDKAYTAKAKSSNYQSKIAQERLKLVDDYRQCVKKAGEDKPKIEACDSYLKAAEALQ